MSRNKLLKIIISAVFVALIIFIITVYVVDIVSNNSAPTKNLFKTLGVVAAAVLGIIRIWAGSARGRNNLDFYQREYADQIKNAFADSPASRKKLLCAIRLYNENNLKKAAKYLISLKPLCKRKDDFYAVGLFIALVFTDMGLANEAIDVYNQLLKMDITSRTIYGNLGFLYSNIGQYDDAIANLRLSIQNDEKNPAAYNNLAKLYFDTFDFENAKGYAMKALEVNHKFRQSATLLAVIFSLEDDKENAEKYSHIALSCGEAPDTLKRVIEHYKAIQNDFEPKDTNNDEE